MNYARIKDCDIADGEGVRVSLFVSGCTHHCVGCFNKETWDFDYGKPFTKEVEDKILKLLSKDYITGLTLLGGEPFEVCNQEALHNLLVRVKAEFPDKDVWCYTGYTFEDLLDDKGTVNTKYTKGMLSFIDVLVDGEFMLERKSLGLTFKGSDNQRIIDVKESLKKGITVEKEFYNG